MGRRIHITGASGTGTSTLARALANALASQAFDTDDFYWQPGDPPFRRQRPVEERLRLMEALFLPRPDWVLSGSLHAWGAPAMDRVTHVVFLTLPGAERLRRLRGRERLRFGSRILAGGDMEAEHRGFLDWAMRYDEPGTEGRSRATHEAWLSTLSQPVIRLDAAPGTDALVAAIRAELDGAEGAG